MKISKKKIEAMEKDIAEFTEGGNEATAIINVKEDCRDSHLDAIKFKQTPDYSYKLEEFEYYITHLRNK